MHKVGAVYNEQFLIPYDTVDCESPDRVAALWTSIGDTADLVEARPCSMDDALLCHIRNIEGATREDFFQSAAAYLSSALEGGYYIPDLGKNARAYLEGVAAACS